MGLLAIVVGNTNTRFATFEGRNPLQSAMISNADMDGLITGIADLDAGLPAERRSVVVMASDNQPFSERLFSALEPKILHEIFRIGCDLEAPIARAIDADTQPGQDRLLNALAAYDILQQACVIVDAGTAVTIDFVDGQGVFQGGAIAPGANMMLQAMHKGTAALPDVRFARPDDSAFGKNTKQAMLNGVFYGIRGMVSRLVERYAEAYEAYPLVIATGSDAPLLFADDPFVDRIVPDLTLRGIEVAYRRMATE